MDAPGRSIIQQMFPCVLFWFTRGLTAGQQQEKGIRLAHGSINLLRKRSILVRSSIQFNRQGFCSLTIEVMP